MTTSELVEPNEYSAPDEFGGEEEFSYRAMSRSAIVALLLSLVSVISFLYMPLLFLPILAGLLALAAIVSIRRNPQELIGYPVAIIALLVSVLVFAGGAGYHAYVYATEVPEGFQRVGFTQLKARPDHMAVSAVPPEALALDGKKIFIKGYIHPAVNGRGRIKEFILVPDMGTCCFGGQPALTDMIEVKLKGDLRTSYNQYQRKLAGVFKISDRRTPKIGDIQGGFYQMEVEYLK